MFVPKIIDNDRMPGATHVQLNSTGTEIVPCHSHIVKKASADRTMPNPRLRSNYSVLGLLSIEFLCSSHTAPLLKWSSIPAERLG